MQTITEKKKLVSYVTTMRLSEKGQLVLPKEFRDEQGLESGSPISILQIGNSLLLLPEMSKFNALCDSIESTLTKAGITSDEVLTTLPETRDEVFAELYPKLSKKKRK
ncbi:MAG TPA: AbrB/MazE/SpoVT family DNA-binding domain-containing protein [Pyrinomonadaceae bacterium]|jgi:AbrB family looped-hinge helix DNA binding protein|nr:AbrB/MazE/SpoVT family DNA-binding domain-containing protein [Pyrinomonadaceae bacterium]